MKKSICLIPGDGIGPDVIDEAVKVLSKVAQKFNHEFEYKKILAGGAAIDAFGDKKKFLDQFDVAEKAIIHANKGASEQALTAYFDEVSKKNAFKC